jgi:2,3-bisphosphoglycerate-independent phosphoglycerate mutase
MNSVRKTIIFLPDGMADEPLSELGGRTPLQHVDTPGMDRIAREGRSGTLLTLPKDYPTSSDVANMSVLGCDLKTEYCGRGVLEAASQGIPLGPQDIAFRCNLISVAADGTLADFSGGHIAQADAEALIRELNAAFSDGVVRFHPGVSYRNLLILSEGGYSAAVYCEKPDDNPGNPVAEHLPRAEAPAGESTAALLRDLMARAATVLAASEVNRRAVAEGRLPANGIWLWSPGRAGAIRTLRERHGISSAVISAVDVIKGLGRCLGMDVIPVPGATGYIDTNYEGKAQAAIAAIQTHDLVYVHVEAIDEVSHAMDLKLKLKAIEDFDRRIVVPVMRACGKGVRYVVLPDHPVPIRIGKHTRTPVPVALCGPGIVPDGVEVFDECAAPCGALGALFGPELMEYLFGEPEPGVGG